VLRKTVLLLLVSGLCALPGFSSQQQVPQDLPIPQQNVPGREEPPTLPPHIQKEMEKRANEQRQAELKRDTERLLKLSTELKEYVDKSNENVLSLDVLKKAEEIEKLAHSVKIKMRGSN
jgi:hypothetical protein